MPELPDLEAIKDFLNRKVVGLTIESATVINTIPIRRPGASEFAATLTGNALVDTQRRGKFLLLSMRSGHTLAINSMLTGRLQYATGADKQRAKTCFVLRLEDGNELRYFDSKLMGKIYLVPEANLNDIPGFEIMGPEVADESISLEEFQSRLKRHSGQIKNILVNAKFLAGIGNAYADEVLFHAGIYPYRRRSTLKVQEIERLHLAIGEVLQEGREEVSARMGEAIHIKIRDFLKVHGKGGQPCPTCGHTISQITANQRLTNFCRQCQK